MKIPTIPSVATLVLCLVSVTSPVQAFLSPNLNLRNTQTVPIGQPRSETITSSHVRIIASTSTTALHANLFDRFFRVARGNLNSLVSRFEDPEKVMELTPK